MDREALSERNLESFIRDKVIFTVGRLISRAWLSVSGYRPEPSIALVSAKHLASAVGLGPEAGVSVVQVLCPSDDPIRNAPLTSSPVRGANTVLNFTALGVAVFQTADGLSIAAADNLFVNAMPLFDAALRVRRVFSIIVLEANPLYP